MTRRARQAGEPTPTIALVADFANRSQEYQLQELSRLRRKSSPRLATYVAAVAVGMTFLVGVISFMLNDAPDVPALPLPPEVLKSLKDWEPIGFALALIFVFFTALWSTRVYLRNATDAADAQVLLAAYEYEIARRQQARGRLARAWRRRHPIHWSKP